MDQPKVEADIELLMETPKECVWKKEDAKMKKEKREGIEGHLKERKTYGEGEQGMWWEGDSAEE